MSNFCYYLVLEEFHYLIYARFLDIIIHVLLSYHVIILVIILHQPEFFLINFS